MKRILNLAFLLLLCIAVKAQTNTTAEVFIEVSDEGRYTIALNDQSITSNHSRFRFFELMPGNAAITITSKDGELLTSNITVSANQRYIFQLLQTAGFKARYPNAILQRR